jgi:chromosome segregation ATPase
MTLRLLQVPTVLVAVAALMTCSLHAADPQVEAVLKRMREGLRNTMTQLQTAQTENAALQTQVAEKDQKIKDLEAKIDDVTKKLTAQTKQMAEEKTAADKTSTELNAAIADRDQKLADVNAALAKWKEGYNKVASIARQKDAERANLASRVIALDQKVADRERQNIDLYKTGKEILGRYENFGLGNALLAREPFTGTARVKLETQIQDYRDKLQDQKVKPNDATAKGSNPAPTPAATAKPATAAAPASNTSKSTDQKSKS